MRIIAGETGGLRMYTALSNEWDHETKRRSFLEAFLL
jgi:hypothetical protein